MKNSETIWIFGSNSFLGALYSKFLINKKLHVVNFSKTNVGYSIQSIENEYKRKPPSLIYDFKFPSVNSRLVKTLDDNSFKPQFNLINVLEKHNYNKKLILITTDLINNNSYKESEYVKKKLKQENLYKSIKNKFDIDFFYSSSIFGYPDLNASRVIPYYFYCLKNSIDICFSSDGQEKRQYIYINDFREQLYTFSFKKNEFNPIQGKYSLIIGDLMHTVNTLSQEIFSKEINLFWKNDVKINYDLLRNEELIEKLKITTQKYIANLKELKFFNT